MKRFNKLSLLLVFCFTALALGGCSGSGSGTPSTYTITYDYQGATGGNSDASATVTQNQRFNLAVPSLTNYTFGGWYDAIGGGGTEITDSTGASKSTYSYSENKTLYAYWKGSEGLNYSGNPTMSVSPKYGVELNGAIYIQPYVAGLPVVSVNGFGGTGITASKHQITSISMPETITRIDDNTFRNCTSLNSINFSSNLTAIGQRAFWGCTSLYVDSIPQSVTSIGMQAFVDTVNWTNVINVNDIADVVFADNWLVGHNSEIGTTLTNPLNILNDINIRAMGQPTIGISSYAFSRCTTTSVTIPSSVKIINDRAFYECANLKTVYFERSVNDGEIIIGSEIFWFNYGINTGIENIYVPDEDSLELYKTLLPDYADIISVKS